MYKLLIVDDESEVTEGIAGEIDWRECGFTEVETAGNGREAMDIFDRLKPDVLITDINMPYVSGLELAEWVKRTYPITRIVILSGYDEFDYAKQALQLQVDDYVLKPFSGEQLTATVHKVVNRMNEERERLSNIELLQEHYRTSLPIVREKFLSSLITRKQPLSVIRDKAERYDMRLEGQGYVVSVIGVPLAEERSEEGENGSAVRTLPLSGDLDLMLFTVSNIADEIWAKYELGKVFIHQDHVVLFTVSPNSQMDSVMNQTQNALNEVLQSIETYLRFPVTIGIGTFVHDIGYLKASYETAVTALDYRRLLGNNRIIYIGDLERVQHKLVFDEVKEHSLVQAVKLGTEQELQKALDSLFEEISRSTVPVHEYELYMLEMITAIMKITKDIQSGADDLFSGGQGILNQYRKLNSVEETRAWFGDLCAKLRGRIAAGRQRASQRIVEEAVNYTKSQYHDAELSIAKVCDHLHISPGYFSGLFKREMKMTFGAYLLQLRMEKTKELLRTTSLKQFEIADKVGFSDPNYLGMCFKKYTGLTPKEYRSGLEEHSG